MNAQDVYLSKTESGIHGIFTNGFLVQSIEISEFVELNLSESKFSNYCKKFNFNPVFKKFNDISFTYK